MAGLYRTSADHKVLKYGQLSRRDAEIHRDRPLAFYTVDLLFFFFHLCAYNKPSSSKKKIGTATILKKSK